MPPDLEPSQPIPRAAALLSIALGALTLAGWALDIEFLKTGGVGSVVMKANTALALCLVGIALWLVTAPTAPWRARLGDICVLLVGGIGVATLTEYTLDRDLGIDQWLFRDVATTLSPIPGRPAANTALAFVFLATALWRRDRIDGASRWRAEGGGLAVFILGLTALLGDLFRAELHTGIGDYSHMALPTAAVLIILAFGVVFVRPLGPVAALCLSDGPGGSGIRRIFPAVSIGIILLSWLRLVGQDRGLYDTGFGIVVTTLITLGILGAAIVWHAAVVDQADADRRQAEEALQESEERQRLAAEAARIGIWSWNSPSGSGEWTPQCKALLGLTSEGPVTFSQFTALVHPEDRAPVQLAIERSWQEATEYRIEFRAFWPDGSTHWLSAVGRTSGDQTRRGRRMLGVVMDVTERRQAEEELRRSNADLEQFAYVASHDLQEPLRMVASYVQLLAKRYQGKLDADANEFIGYALDGAMRMQRLISDLLAYARVGTRGTPHVPTDPAEALAHALASLEVTIAESGATVTHDPMPLVLADPRQLEMMLLNLVGNGIKFHGPTPPRVHVSAKRTPEGIHFTVRDNGIGIDPKYHERIFVIFQRLHGRTEYPGTGIGLAIVKRIVERHGGRLWLDSAPDLGTTIHFTLPPTSEL